MLEPERLMGMEPGQMVGQHENNDLFLFILHYKVIYSYHLWNC